MESKKGREGDQCVEYPHVQFGEGEVEPVATLRRGTPLSKKLIVLAMAMVAIVTFAVPEVTDVTAKQRYPWNGLVDITCKVSGIDGMTNGITFGVSAIMPDSGDVHKMSHFWVVQNGTNSISQTVSSNGNYRLLWDTCTDLGQVIYSNMVLRVTAHYNVQLWENGPYWADTNIGAEEPWEYGYYFWWGDNVGYKYENNCWVASDKSSSNFSFTYNGAISGQTYRKNIVALRNKGWITGDNVLSPEHDAAQTHWGGRWRMPTKQEAEDLISKCDWTWTMVNGVNGYVVCGRGKYASASIFLPGTGCGYESTLLTYDGLMGLYWVSVPCDPDDNNAWRLCFDADERRNILDVRGGDRYYGQSIRPVRDVSE